MKSASPLISVGLIGSAIQQSQSPAMHEAEAAALGLHLRYRLFDMQALGVGLGGLSSLLDQAETEGFAGVNITHPCKQAVIPLLHEVSSDAAMIGAVNTVVFEQGRRHGYNTDEWGFRESFGRQMAGAALGNIVQLGAGGAGAATGHAMLQLGTERLTVFDPDQGRAEQLTEKLAARFGSKRVGAGTALATTMADADGLVHATPTGMAGHPGLPLPAELLRPALWVAEVVYFPLETPLLASARALGCRVVDGGGMAVFQAAKAFELFTGVAPDAERMLARFRGNPP
jgi:shikimate dehydrogenase